MNPRLEALHAYPFERLARLKAGITAPSQLEPIAMSIGEPQHTPPAFLLEALRRHLDRLGSYPATAGLPELRAACAGWLTRRYGLSAGSVDADTMVLPVNGTREALFAFVQAAQAAGRARFERCVVFHSLSKRSSVPGLRSGFVAGDPAIMARLLLYRTYHGSAMPVPTQLASAAAWQDDAHAASNRRLYQEKFARVLPLLTPLMSLARPAGAFYLWPHVGGDDERFTRELFARENLTVLPGSYLGRTGVAGNPGAGRVRISLVPEVARCVEAAQRLREFLQTHWLAPGAGTSA